MLYIKDQKMREDNKKVLVNRIFWKSKHFPFPESPSRLDRIVPVDRQ